MTVALGYGVSELVGSIDLASRLGSGAVSRGRGNGFSAAEVVPGWIKPMLDSAVVAESIGVGVAFVDVSELQPYDIVFALAVV